MVERGVLLALRASGKVGHGRRVAEAAHKLLVVVTSIGCLRSAKPGEAAPRMESGRDVDVVPEHDRVRRRDDERVGGARGNTTPHLLVGIDGGLDAPLLSVAHGRDDQGRMRNCKRSDDCHGSLPLTL